MEATGCEERSARARVRNNLKLQYQAMGIVDKETQGFRSATEALTTIAGTEHIVPRRGGVAPNLTTAGMHATGLMSSWVENDVTRRMPEINQAQTEKEMARILKNAMSERPERYKRFNFFHADPSKIGLDAEQWGIQTNCTDQANHYINQPEEKRLALRE